MIESKSSYGGFKEHLATSGWIRNCRECSTSLPWLAPDRSVGSLQIGVSGAPGESGNANPLRVFYLHYEETMQSSCLRLMGKKLLVSLAMEGKFSRKGLQSLDEEDDMLTAMARELVTKKRCRRVRGCRAATDSGGVRIPVKWGTDSAGCGAASERSDAGYGHDLKVPHMSQDFPAFEKPVSIISFLRFVSCAAGIPVHVGQDSVRCGAALRDVGQVSGASGADSGEAGRPDSVTPPVRQPAAEAAGDDACCHRRSSVSSFCRTCCQ